MKFVLQETPRFWWPVTVKMPDPKAAGKTISQTLKCQFTGMTRSMALEMKAGDDDAMFKQIITDWDDILDADGNPVQFSEEAFAQALDLPWFRAGLWTAIGEATRGEPALKN